MSVKTAAVEVFGADGIPTVGCLGSCCDFPFLSLFLFLDPTIVLQTTHTTISTSTWTHKLALTLDLAQSGAERPKMAARRSPGR